MSRGFLERLDAELSDLTRRGAHLDACGGGTLTERTARHRRRLVRRGTVAATVIVALAASLVSEFPASAGGHAVPTPRVAARAA